MHDRAGSLRHELSPLGAAERLQHVRNAAAGRIVFTTSFGLEDQVLTHLIAGSGLDIELATLDTGRLFPETYALWARTEARYGLRIRPVYPDHLALEHLVSVQGIDGFYSAVAARQACCGVRKVEPLARALAGAEIWLTGLRAEQSADRAGLSIASWDEARGLTKVNPLIDWFRADALDFARRWDVPINPLHDQGYLSIGCAPCTRAVRPGEPERAGRWWWEQEGQSHVKTECGLHMAPQAPRPHSQVPA